MPVVYYFSEGKVAIKGRHIIVAYGDADYENEDYLGSYGKYERWGYPVEFLFFNKEDLKVIEENDEARIVEITPAPFYGIGADTENTIYYSNFDTRFCFVKIYTNEYVSGGLTGEVRSDSLPIATLLVDKKKLTPIAFEDLARELGFDDKPTLFTFASLLEEEAENFLKHKNEVLELIKEAKDRVVELLELAYERAYDYGDKIEKVDDRIKK
ncbi:MAG: hypothetical protein ABDH28_04375 [Brevinematia bacterium]